MWTKFKWDMFVTSFIPLWVSILIVDVCNYWALLKVSTPFEGEFFSLYLILFISIVIVIILVIVSLVGVNSFLKKLNASENNPKGKIIKAQRSNKLSSEFLLAYILPMIAFNFADLQNLIQFIVYFSVLAFLCIRNNNVYTNIFLEFKGYKIYTCNIECSVANGKHVYEESIIISPKDLTLEESNVVSYWDCENYIYIIVSEEGRQHE